MASKTLKTEKVRKVIHKIDKEKIVFSEFEPVEEKKLTGGFSTNKKGGKYNLYIAYSHDGEKAYPLIISPFEGVLFSFGVQKARYENKDIKGYDIHLAIDEETQKDQGVADFLNALDILRTAIAEKIYEYRSALGLDENEGEEYYLNAVKPLVHAPEKKEEGKINSLIIYTKTLMDGNETRMYTRFYDLEDNQVDYKELLGQYLKIHPAILIDKVYVDTSRGASAQLKMSEAIVKIAEGNHERMTTLFDKMKM